MEKITFDGYDPVSETTIKKINVWCDYKDRGKGTVATVKHGSKGELLERKGNGCKMKVRKGLRSVEGWLAFYFIKELKAPYLEEFSGD